MKTTTMPVPQMRTELCCAQQEFVARGLASREAAKKSGIYFSADEVLSDLDHILGRTKEKAGK